MFQVKDIVVHPVAGICRIKDIRTEKFGDRPLLYYVMTPLDSNGRNLIFTPVEESRIRLRRPLTKEEIETILRQVLTAEIEWPEDEKERSAQLSLLLRTGDQVRIVKMIAQLHHLKETRIKQRKKLNATEERLLQEAQNMIHGEFSFALGLDEDETIRHIMEKLAM